MNKNFKRYILFWFSQAVSQFGSAMTSFALVIWAYTQTNSVMAVSLMTFCSYVPYIIVSLFVGAFIDSHNKKMIMLCSDFIAAVCSLFVVILWNFGNLQIWHIYIVNLVIGFMNAFQSPARSVAIGKLVTEEKLSQASGMDSFSTNLVTVVSPVLASSVLAYFGLEKVVLVDLATFLFAFLVLLLFIKIPESMEREAESKSAIAGCKDGFRFLLAHRGLWYIVITLAVINFFSRLTYENILSPMILARSGGDSGILGMVNAVLGIGGIVGGIIVSAGKFSRDKVRMIYFAAGLSFLLGDVLMGIGRGGIAWSIAGIAASAPIPFIIAGQQTILYKTIPEEMQGRVFSVRNAIQFSTIPIGILLGGSLAEYVFEPFMNSDSSTAKVLHYIVGTGTGSGMAVMFLCTGILGSVACVIAYRLKEIQKLRSIQ
ncbi:MFS transporter [Neobacillus dielmonensis]|uniref:MFS transporter n=1 Tax=Neobacillus dielmonensis TaxID=1347369 RepID=UPI0005A732D9|nr:MFS transporter [Neobacillus dielmonensis]